MQAQVNEHVSEAREKQQQQQQQEDKGKSTHLQVCQLIVPLYVPWQSVVSLKHSSD